MNPEVHSLTSVAARRQQSNVNPQTRSSTPAGARREKAQLSPQALAITSTATPRGADQLTYKCHVHKVGDIHRIAVDRVLPEDKVPQGLTITFYRSIHAPGHEIREHPDNLGTFPLYNVQDYQDTFPRPCKPEGGVFFPIAQREAMRIGFQATAPFMIKIYVGRVNAVSGDSHREIDLQARVAPPPIAVRRKRLMEIGYSCQDYIVVPGQSSLDGANYGFPGWHEEFNIHSRSRRGIDPLLDGLIQFEITPALSPPMYPPRPLDGHIWAPWMNVPPPELPDTYDKFQIHVQDSVESVSYVLHATSRSTVADAVAGMNVLAREPDRLLRLLHEGTLLEDCTILSSEVFSRADCDLPVFKKSNKFDVCVDQASSAAFPPKGGNCVTTSGYVRQEIWRDQYDTSLDAPCRWACDRSIVIPVRMINTLLFEEITGTDVPASPINSHSCAQAGFGLVMDMLPKELGHLHELAGSRTLALGPQAWDVQPAFPKMKGLATIVGDDDFQVLNPDGVCSSMIPRAKWRDVTLLREGLLHLIEPKKRTWLAWACRWALTHHVVRMIGDNIDAHGVQSGEEPDGEYNESEVNKPS